MSELALYRGLLAEIKSRVRAGQQRAILAANAEMLQMYWDVGRMIAARQKTEGWGAGVIPRLAVDLKNELPEEKGFSERNIGRMIAFYREYPELPTGPLSPKEAISPAILPPPVAKIQTPQNDSLTIGPQPVAQLQNTENQYLEIGQPAVAQLKSTIGQPPVAQLARPKIPSGLEILLQISWTHNVILMQKLKDLPTRLWYARQTLEQGWSRDALALQIKNRLHERQGGAVNNFSQTLATAHASLAQGLLKDPYLFDFFTLNEPFHERELETGLLTHIQKFLIELGRGFAFVGRQYHLAVSDKDFYLDLLFYHLQLRCFIVVELKRGDFKPEYAGKMNFYCSVVDDQLRHPADGPTLGLILCQTKDRVLAEYSLRDINKPIGVADYELTQALPAQLASVLPSIEQLEAELSRTEESL